MAKERHATRARWHRLGAARGAGINAGRINALIAVAVGLLLGVGGLQLSALGERLDEIAFDLEAQLVRGVRGSAQATPPIVLVGVDEDSLNALGVPMAMMHSALGRALEAVASGGPRAIGLDIGLPQTSFDNLVPGLDRELMRGLRAARSSSVTVIALDADAGGRLRVPWLPLLAVAGGPQAFALPLFPVDCDGVIRRFDPDPVGMAARSVRRCGALLSEAGPAGGIATMAPFDAELSARATRTLPTFVARLARALGRDQALAQAGWIDFTRGPAFSYVPLREVIGWHARGELERLRSTFGGQVVLIGSVLPYIDRVHVPVNISSWEQGETAPPGIVVNAQVLRNALDAGLVLPVPWPLQAGLLLLMLGLAFLRASVWRAPIVVAALALALAAVTVLHGAGWFLPPATALSAAIAVTMTRSALDLAHARAERERLARLFGGYLSPPLLRAILEDRVTDGSGLRAAALLFADLRGFTAWSEHADPLLVRDTLNQWLAVATPLLHARGGTIDNFRGDGIMVIFGAPERCSRVCDAAFAAARDLLQALENLNREQFAPRGIPTLQLAIGLASGEVLVGDLGSADRKDYTALGDAVNVAARLEELAKQLGYPLVMTRQFALDLKQDHPDLCDLGMRELRGHSALEVFGWPAHVDGVATTANGEPGTDGALFHEAQLRNTLSHEEGARS